MCTGKSPCNHTFNTLSSFLSEFVIVCRELDKPVCFFLPEFDNWYAESFLNQSEDVQSSVAAGHGVRPGIFIPYNPNAMVCTLTIFCFVLFYCLCLLDWKNRWINHEIGSYFVY